MFERFVGFALLVVLIGSVTAQETPKIDDSLFPTAVGNKWVYGIVGKDKEYTITIARTEKVGEQECIVLEASMDVTKEGKTTREVVATEYTALVKGEYRRLKLGTISVVPPLTFLKANAKKDDSWTSSFELQVTAIDEKSKQPTVEKLKATTAYAIATDKITVPAGTFDCIAVKATTTEEGDKVTKSTVWYAKDVGPVKQEFDFGKDEQGKETKFTLELKSSGAGGK